MAKIIRVFVHEATDDVIASHRRIIEDSNMRVVGEPAVTRIPNEGYIEAPDAPDEVDMVAFEVEPVR